MIESHGKLLISAFIAIIIGLVLVQIIGDDIELAKVSSRTILNESVALTVVTTDIVNETSILVDNTSILANNYLTELTGLRNLTSDDVFGFCNITLTTGVLVCNDTTGSTTVYADYTYNDHSTGQLSSSYDEWLSFDACRNSTMTAILVDTHCNVTLDTGAVRVDYDNFSVDDLAYIDYKYEPDTYVHNSAARTILTLTILFFVLSIVAIGIGYAWKSLKESDMF